MKSKTIYGCIAAILTAWATYFGGELSIQSAIAATFVGLIGIFMRQGIAKAIPPVLILFLVTGCGTIPVSATAQGAQFAEQQGQATESGSAITYANPIFYCIIGAKRITIKGEAVEVVGGDGDLTIDGNLTFPSVIYTDAEVSAEVSSGGGGEAATRDAP